MLAVPLAVRAAGQIMLPPFRAVNALAHALPIPAGPLARWRASDLVGLVQGDPVASWPDASGNGYTLTQVTPSLRPAYSTQTVCGKPGVYFDALTGAPGSILNISAGLSVGSQAMTMFMMAEFGRESILEVSISLGSSQLTMYHPDVGDDFKYNFGSTSDAALGMQPCGPSAMGISAGAASLIAYREFTSNTFAPASAITVTGGQLGSFTASPLLCFDGTMLEVLIYGRALTPAEMSVLFAYSHATYKSLVAKPYANVVCTGDSITAGNGAMFHNYPALLDAGILAAAKTAWVKNMGVPGRTIADMLSNHSAEDAQYDGSYSRNILMVWAGSNDLNAGTTPAVIYADTVSYCQALRAVGYRVAVCTTLPRIGGAEANRLALNALIVVNWPTFADALADVASNPIMGANPPNASYYADGVHPNAAGYDLLAPYLNGAAVSVL